MSETTISAVVRQRLRQCLQGDQEARNELFVQVRGRLEAIVLRTFHSLNAAACDRAVLSVEDCVQEACMRLVQRWDQMLEEIRRVDDPVRWFFAVSSRLIRDVVIESLRKAQRRVARGGRPVSREQWAEEEEEVGGWDPSDTTFEPNRLAMWAEVHEFFESLPSPLKEVADLRWYHGLPHEEIAAILGLAGVTVRSHWSKVRLLLQRKFPDLQLLA